MIGNAIVREEAKPTFLRKLKVLRRSSQALGMHMGIFLN